MKNQKGISLIKFVIILAIIIFLLFIISRILIKVEEDEEIKLEQARLVAKQEAICNIGDKITTDKYEITVKNIEERTKVGIAKYYSTVDDFYYTLICSTIEIKNISSEPIRIYDSRPDFSMYFHIEDLNENHKYYNDATYTTHYEFEFDQYNIDLTVKPGETVNAYPVFRVDKNTYQSESLYLNILGDTALVKIN